jgi:hypothetical protein
MKKHLLSNWINVFGTIGGLYCILFFMALQQLFTSERGFTFETVFLETIGGSFIYTYGILIQHLIPFLIYIGLLFLVDFVLFRNLKGQGNLSKLISIETIIFSILFIVYAIREEGLNLLILPFTFALTQWIRKKKLLKLDE